HPAGSRLRPDGGDPGCGRGAGAAGNIGTSTGPRCGIALFRGTIRRRDSRAYGNFGANCQSRLGHGKGLEADTVGREGKIVTPDRWAVLREIFGKALEAPESERSAVLDSACNGDLDLRAEVERLLVESETPSWQPPVGLFPALPKLAPGDTLTHVRIDARPG